VRKKILFIVGPTAVGKSETAVYLAKKIDAEIISCDSMQIYKGMDIITSKPGLALRKKIKHHLIDIASPSKEYDVSTYRKAAIKKIKEIIRKKKVPLFVGGTGLYASILIDGIFKEPNKLKIIRIKLYEEAEEKGVDFLYRRLEQIDPKAALKIHPNDKRRIIRALEVFKSTGQPISKLQAERRGLSDDYEVRFFCLNIKREGLYQRIDQRVERMFRQGVVREVSRMLKKRLSRTAGCAIGIRELKGYFSGEYDLAEARGIIKRNSRRYAKRQLTWFRKDRRIKWIEVRGNEKPSSVADRIWKEHY